MFCPSCGAVVQAGQKFCVSCGVALTSPPTAPSVAADASSTPPMGNPLPPPPPPTTVIAAATPTATPQYPPTTPVSTVGQTTAPTAAVGTAWGSVTDSWEPTGDAPPIVAVQPFRMTPLVIAASLAGVLAVAAAFVTVLGLEVSGVPGLPVSEDLYKINDFSSNNMVGAIIAAVVLIVGASMGATGRRLGTGLAGGAGLALAGMMSMMLGSATQIVDSYEFGLSGSGVTLTITRDIGYWLALVAAILGGVVFVLSFEAAGPDGHQRIPTGIAALGLVGTAMAVFGPLIPLHSAPFGDQFSNDFTPPATLLLRQLVLVLIAVGGIVGFGKNRRWGLGLAFGSISVGAWQLITAVTESGDIPLSYAGSNPGAVDFKPHVVSIIGVASMIVACLVGLIVASQQRKRA
ncbi:MAG: zinc ribbon domain-containing protein [Actinobacteria bacterium]|nr:zinc ribbon domain-containing protein [Actinomycetota bacterium]